MNNMNQFMAIHTDDEKNGDILGKYMYYSLPKLIIKAERVREICEQIGFPVTVNENISVTDAFRSATGEIHDRIEDPTVRKLKFAVSTAVTTREWEPMCFPVSL